MCPASKPLSSLLTAAGRMHLAAAPQLQVYRTSSGVPPARGDAAISHATAGFRLTAAA
jgi:hypothetical protein